MGGLPLTWLDVFTARRLTGNPLAVVHDADALDEATMLAFARETGLSETTFVQAPRADEADYRNRIFMTGGELPFAGHPSLGTAVAVAAARGEREARYVQETPSGLQAIEVTLGADGASARAQMLLEVATFGPELDPAAALGVAGLGAGDADPDLPVQVVGTGVTHVIAPVRGAALERLAPDPLALRALLRAHGAVVLYLAAVDGARARARSLFLDAGAVAEDPATGSAAGPLMANLHARTGATALAVEQGVEMGRPSRLGCAIDPETGRVSLGGEAVVVATGTVRL